MSSQALKATVQQSVRMASQVINHASDIISGKVQDGMQK